MKTVVVAVLVIGALGACGEVQTAAPDAADPCATATCECTAATEVTDCGAHAICNEAGPGRVCECAAAYTDQGGACVFVGAPLDKGFMDPSKWTTIGLGTSVNAGAAGNLDPGEVQVNRIAMCNGGGVTQTFTMPAFDRADPFKLSITHTGIDAGNFDIFGSQVQAGVGGQFFESQVTPGQYKTETFCLGPRAYGGPVDFRIGTFGGPGCNSTSASTINVDQMAIQVAAQGECPAPNTIVNGDFEAFTGWTFTTTQGASGSIAGGIGENGSQAAQLATTNRCSEATMTGTIGFPSNEAVPNQAIEVFYNATPGQRLTFQLGSKNVAVLVKASSSGMPERTRICVPDWAVGTSSTIGFFLQRNSDNACTTPLNKNYMIDSLKIVSDPACAPQLIEDPGFERAADPGHMPGWGLTNGYVNDQEGSTAVIVSNTGVAHTGTSALRLGGANECVIVGAGGADISFFVPPAAGTAGPAVKFFANVGLNNLKTTTRAAVFPFFGGVNSIDVPEAGVYKQSTLCLPPSATGRRISVRFSTGDSDGGGCGANYAEEVAFIDDVELTTDPSCPAN
jgi:hypothetical protein